MLRRIGDEEEATQIKFIHCISMEEATKKRDKIKAQKLASKITHSRATYDVVHILSSE